MTKLFFSLLALTAATLLADEPDRAAKVLTAEMASRVLGEAVEPGLRNTMPDEVSGKSWVSIAAYSTRNGLDRKTITLFLRHEANAATTQKSFDSTRGALKGTPMTNLGDAAYRTETPAQLNFRIGADWFTISAGTASSPDTELQEKVAREILARLAQEK